MNGHRVLRALVVAAAAAAIAGGAAESQAASPALIVFSADRAPFLSGEIYRIDSSGHNVDLSADTAAVDTNPVVSPDGKHVAFLSNRSGQEGIYEVGIDGSGLVQVGQKADVPHGAQLAWQPHGDLLAVGAGNGLWIVRPGGASVHMRSASGVYGWSPDGRVLAATEDIRGTYSRALALSPSGHALWRVKISGLGYGTWSAHGLLAVNTGRSVAGARQAIAVYDEAGHLRFKVPFGRLHTTQTWSPSATWSPDGNRLALASGHAFEVRTTAGRVLLRKRVSRLSDLGLLWDGSSRIVIAGYGACQCHAKSVDIRTGRTSPASDRFARHQTSPDGRLAILEIPHGDEFEIQVAPTAGGPAHTYARVPACVAATGQTYADFGAAQFVRGNHSIVYPSICSSPITSLYSVSAVGGPAHRITASQAMYWSPALSPDGSKIAYVTNRCAGLDCGRPTSSIGVLNVDGSGEHVIATPTHSSSTCSGDYDESPSWSPDGATILFGTTTCDSGTAMPELYTVPANGGATHDLGFRGYQATWGPSRIAYVDNAPSGASPGTFIWTANPNGTDRVPIAGSSGASSPAWSPNGQLAFLRNNNRKVVVGSSESTFPFASVLALAWSPDGDSPSRYCTRYDDRAARPLHGQSQRRRSDPHDAELRRGRRELALS